MKIDGYLDLIITLFKTDRIDIDTAIKKVSVYLISMGLSNKEIDEFIDKNILAIDLNKKKEYLSNIYLDDSEPKYADIINKLSDEEINKVYEYEKKNTKEIKRVPDGMEVPEPTVIEKVDVVEYDKEVSKKDEVDKSFKPLTDEDLNPKKEEPIEEEHESVMGIIEDEELTEEEIKETKESAVDFEDIVNNINKNEESTVRKVDVSPERLSKLKESKKKLNVKRLLMNTAVVVGAMWIQGPIVGGFNVGVYAVMRTLIKKDKFNPKSKIGKTVKKGIQGLMNVFDNKFGPLMEEGGKSK